MVFLFAFNNIVIVVVNRVWRNKGTKRTFTVCLIHKLVLPDNNLSAWYQDDYERKLGLVVLFQIFLRISGQ